MEDLRLWEKFTSLIKKYRYVILVCLMGVFLMLLPEMKDATEGTQNIPQEIQDYPDQAELLENILSKIHGAGRVEVMLTVAAGQQTIYQTDPKGSFTSESESNQTQTVLVTSSDKNQTGLIKQILPQIYLGAIVVCQGADDPNVRLAIVEAVSDVTGLSTDKISVLKMK